MRRRLIIAALLWLGLSGSAWAQSACPPFADNNKLTATQLNNCFTAQAPHVATNTALQAACTSATGCAASGAVYTNGVWRDDFATGNGAPPLFYRPSATACAGNNGTDNGFQVASGNGAFWCASFPPGGGDIREFGADTTGVADSAPAIRAAIGVAPNNAIITIPPGTYLCGSTQTAPSSVVNFNPGCVVISGKNNLAILAYGAKFTLANAVTASSWFEFVSATDFHWFGGEFVGNRSGLASTFENSPFGLANLRNWSVRDVRLSGNWGGSGSISYGDWLRDGVIDNVVADKLGIGLDLAFLKDVIISNIHVVGADTNGNQGAGQVGNKGYSNVYDTVNLGTAVTSIVGTFTDTDGVTVINNDASNFSTGWTVQSGQHYSFIGNYWHDNPGLVSAGSLGLGGFISYNNGGAFSSVGFPPSNIVVRGDKYARNGAAVAGNGIRISSSTIGNTDVISGIDIDAQFDNNTNTGVEADSTAHISNVVVRGRYSGANQTVALGPNLYAIALAATPSTAVKEIDAGGGIKMFGTNVLSNGHIGAHGTAPTNPSAGCGTGPTIATGSGDLAGSITLGTAPGASCALTFAQAWNVNPVCFARDRTSGVILPAIVANTTTLSMPGTLTAGDILEWLCIGYQ